MQTVNGWSIAFSGRSDGFRRQSVGIAMSPAAKQALISTEPMSEGVKLSHFRMKGRRFSVIAAYAPTSAYVVS